MVKKETRTFPVHHLAGRVLIYDWFIRNFIMIVCEKKFLVRIYPKYFLINIHYKTIYELVRSPCFSWRVFMNSVPFILPIFGGQPTPHPPPPKIYFFQTKHNLFHLSQKINILPTYSPNRRLPPSILDNARTPPSFPKNEHPPISNYFKQIVDTLLSKSKLTGKDDRD